MYVGEREPSEQSVEIMRKFSEQYARKSGTYFCMDKGVTAVVIKVVFSTIFLPTVILELFRCSVMLLVWIFDLLYFEIVSLQCLLIPASVK